MPRLSLDKHGDLTNGLGGDGSSALASSFSFKLLMEGALCSVLMNLGFANIAMLERLSLCLSLALSLLLLLLLLWMMFWLLLLLSKATVGCDFCGKVAAVGSTTPALSRGKIFGCFRRTTLCCFGSSKPD